MKVYATFQNSMKGVINLYQNFNKGNLSLQFCIAINPKKPNEIKKGDRIYDYTNAKWFALMEEEANQILIWLQNPQLQSQPLEIRHYPENAMTVLTLSKSEHGIILSYAEIVNKQRTFHLALVLSEPQVMTFINFLRSLPLVKTLSAYFDFVTWKSTSNSNNDYRNNGNRYSNNSTPNTVNNNVTTQQTLETNNQYPQQVNPVLSFIKS